MFWEISLNSQENTCARVSFLVKLQASLSKKKLWHRCFPVNLAKLLRTPFLQNTSGRLLPSNLFLKCLKDQECLKKPLSFNIFLSDIFLIANEIDIASCADDSSLCKTIDVAVKTFKNICEKVIQSFNYHKLAFDDDVKSFCKNRM